MRWISMNTGRGVRRCGRLFCRPSDLGLTFPPPWVSVSPSIQLGGRIKRPPRCNHSYQPNKGSSQPENLLGN